ncbi:hypothetical protein [Streptomyces violascens]|uniref:hypothetical protein n=1 Tax=Streptomyces violascens TaxID=67381 RepID=UPI0036BC9FFC
MTAQSVHSGELYQPPMNTLPELRAALAGLSSLGIPTELESFEAELADTPLDQVKELADRYRAYVLRNTTPGAVAALTMSSAESAAVLRRKIAEAGR